MLMIWSHGAAGPSHAAISLFNAETETSSDDLKAAFYELEPHDMSREGLCEFVRKLKHMSSTIVQRDVMEVEDVVRGILRKMPFSEVQDELIDWLDLICAGEPGWTSADWGKVEEMCNEAELYLLRTSAKLAAQYTPSELNEIKTALR
jgi:hypothetical protein